MEFEILGERIFLQNRVQLIDGVMVLNANQVAHIWIIIFFQYLLTDYIDLGGDGISVEAFVTVVKRMQGVEYDMVAEIQYEI